MKDKTLKLDEIDVKILEILQKDAKITAKELASELSLTSTPIYERIKKMENEGLISNYVALLDPLLLGKRLVVFLNITIKEHEQKLRNTFVEELAALDDITELYHTSGQYDFLAKVRFDTIQEYRDFLVNKVSMISNIGDLDSSIVLEEIKSTTAIKLDQL